VNSRRTARAGEKRGKTHISTTQVQTERFNLKDHHNEKLTSDKKSQRICIYRPNRLYPLLGKKKSRIESNLQIQIHIQIGARYPFLFVFLGVV